MLGVQRAMVYSASNTKKKDGRPEAEKQETEVAKQVKSFWGFRTL